MPATPLEARFQALTTTLDALAESVDGISQLALEDRDWKKVGDWNGGADLDVKERRNIASLCELTTAANPLLIRGFQLRNGWIWGGGCDISITTTEQVTDQNTRPILDGFMGRHQQVLFDSQATERLERMVYTRGAIVTMLATDLGSGEVTARIIDATSIEDILTNPDDVQQVWFYKRSYTARTLDAQGNLSKSQTVTVWHPHITHLPPAKDRLESISGNPVRWDQPMFHMAVNQPADPAAQWGFPDAYPALAYARMSKEFLESWFLLAQSLARYAWRTSTKGSRVQEAARRMQAAAAAAPAATPATAGGQVGAHFIADANTTLEAVPKTGAMIDANSGRPIQEMVAAALGVPLAQLVGNASTGDNGSRAALQALDQPTELVMGARRKFWTAYYQTVLGYVLDAAAAASKITGAKPVEQGRGTVWPDTVAHQVTVDWPAFDSVDVPAMVEALVKADGTGKLPPLWVAETLLRIFAGELDLDSVGDALDAITDSDGKWIPPEQSTAEAVKQARDRGEA